MAATAFAKLAVAFTAKTTSFTRGVSRATKSLLGFSKSSKRASRSGRLVNQMLGRMGALVGGAAIVGGFFRLVRSVEEFNQAMNKSTAIMGDVSEFMRTKLERAAIAAAKVTVFSARATASAFFFLASAGLSAEQSIAALPQVTKFAQAGAFDLSRATDLLTDAQSALGLTVKDTARNMQNMARVSDVLVGANTLANASVEQFSLSLTTKAGASLKILGKDIEEGVAVLAAFADQGVKGAESGTALGIVLRDLSTKALKNAKAFRESSIAVFDNAGEMRNIADIIGDLERRLDGLSDAQAKATLLQLGFSDKSVIFVQTLIGMSERIREYETSLRKAGGITEVVAGRQMTKLQEATAKLVDVWSKFSGPISNVVEGLASVLNVVGELVDGFFKLVQLADEFVDRGPLLAAARISGKTGEIVFVSEAEEKRMLEIAMLAEDIDRRAKAAADGTGRMADNTGETARTAEEAAAALQKISEELAGGKEGPTKLETFTKGLRERVGTFGLSEVGTLRQTLGELGGDKQAAKLIDTLEDLTRQQENLKTVETKNARATEAAQRIRERLDPGEVFSKTLSKIQNLFERGFLTGAETTGALEMAKDTLRDALTSALGGGVGAAGVFTSVLGSELGGLPTTSPIPLMATDGRIQEQQLDKLDSIERNIDALARKGLGGVEFI